MDLYSYTIFLVLCMAKLGSSLPSTSNVIDFGAVGDGTTDDSNAFMKAWQAVCSSVQATALTIPSGKTFLLKPVKFLGPCKSPSIRIQVDGNIVAPSKISDWGAPYMGSWIVFQSVNGLKVIGNGHIDGQGSEWWKCAGSSTCQRPKGMKFHACDNSVIYGLKISNTPEKFLSLFDSNNVVISNLHITNPERSPNTDGIDISHSTNVHVTNSWISTGDDCVAIISGCSNITVSKVFCMRGHGISIGSIGHNGDYGTVEGVTVRNCTFGSSTNGARIKTWQGGSGFVRKITYEDIILHNTSNPIVIDQFYCPGSKCSNQTKAVEIRDISYLRFIGTSATETGINIACSQNLACSNVVLDHISITSSNANHEIVSKCFNAHATSTYTFPPLHCS